MHEPIAATPARVRGGGLLLFFLLLVLLTVPTVTAQTTSGGLGVGSGHGQEVGINLDALNQIRADINAGQYNRPCTAAEHDPYAWHTLVNPAAKCYYDHHHGDDPSYVSDIFGPAGSWFGVPGQSISYPWQTFPAQTADEPNTAYIGTGRMENEAKHEGYGWIVRRDQPCPTGNCVRDFRLQYHGIFGSHGAVTRYHSFSLEARLCTNGNDLNTCGIVRYGGWADFGPLITTAPDNISCTHDVAAIPISLPADTLYFPIDRPEARDEVRCHPNVATLPATYPGPRPLAEWWGRGPGETRFQLRSFDPLGNVNPANPHEFTTFCAQDDTDCRFNQSMMSVFIGYTLHIFEFAADGTPIDADRNGRTDYQGYHTRWGGATTGCTQSALDCVPLVYDNVPLNFAQSKEARYAQTVCETCLPVDYDLAPAGQKWITWFYKKYGDGGHGSTEPQPTPTPTGPAVVVEVSPAQANAGEPVSTTLQLYNVSDLYGLQTTCSVDPSILTGAGFASSDTFNDTNSFIVDQGFQPDGRWTVATSRLQPNPAIDGSMPAFTLNYSMVATGSTEVICTVVGVDANGRVLPLEIINGSVATPPITSEPPYPIDEPQPTPIPTTPQPDTPSQISGTVVYQNRPDNSQITVRLYQEQTMLGEVITGADGGFGFTDLATGSYILVAAGPQHIAYLGLLNIDTEGMTLQLDPITLQAGDVDSSGIVDLTDAVFVAANLNQSTLPEIEQGDLNRDGMINVTDLVLVGSNFGLTHPVDLP